MKKLFVVLVAILAVCMLGSAMADVLNIPVLPGSEVEVDVTVSSKDAVFTVLDYTYNKDVLELKNCSVKDGIIYGSSDGKISLARLDPVLNGNLGVLTFKVKAKAADGVSEIKFTPSQSFNYDEKNATLTATNAAVDVTSDQVKAYVKRCYYLLMDRNADQGGLDYWTDSLKKKENNASKIVRDFLSSAEYQGAGHDNTYTISCLYKAMMGRKPDEGGLQFWLGQLEEKGIDQVLNDYCGSAEFKGICEQYGIDPGSGSGSGQEGTGIEGFVRRCYKQALTRDADQGGVDYWVNMMRGGMHPKDVADNFVFSEELTNRNLSNDEFIKTMYRLYMGREADAGGLAYWNGLMDGGMTRKQVCEGFAGSAEFTEIVAGFGL